MSYFPLNPSSIEDEIKINTKNNFNKTVKTRQSATKISSLNDIMSKIHNSNDEDDDEDNNYIKQKNIINQTEFDKHMNINSNNNLTNPKSILKNINSKTVSGYINPEQPILSEYNTSYSKDIYNTQNKQANNRELLDKLNYIVYLLEEQYSEKTKYISEELILYLFLGLFIIFVLDSFAKASKYVR